MSWFTLRFRSIMELWCREGSCRHVRSRARIYVYVCVAQSTQLPETHCTPIQSPKDDRDDTGSHLAYFYSNIRQVPRRKGGSGDPVCDRKSSWPHNTYQRTERTGDA